MQFDREVPRQLMSLLERDGPFGWLISRVRDDEHGLFDLQLRRAPKTRHAWATVYVGLTSVLNLEHRGDQVRLTAHATHRRRGRFHEPWSIWQETAELAAQADAVRGYVDAVVPTVDPRWTDAEGRVHATLCQPGSAGDAYAVIQREASPAFTDMAERAAVCVPMATALTDAVAAADPSEPWWPTANGAPSLGNSPDLVAVDARGRLLVMEAKPADALAGITWGPAQVRFYAELFAELLQRSEDSVAHLRRMLAQRRELGLVTADHELAPDPAVVPVLVIGPGLRSPVVADRMVQVAAALPPSDRVAALECWQLHADGSTTLFDSAVMPPAPAAWVTGSAEQSFYVEAIRSATAWKRSTPALPAPARVAGRYGRSPVVYGHCLPHGHTILNLLPPSRDAILTHFSNAGIPWHGSVAGGPTSNLLSSQVQCANALGPALRDADLLMRIFDGVLDIAEVLDAGDPANPGDLVAFEWIGAEDYLAEGGSQPRTRGANTTSADAMIRYRRSDGGIEVALIEWKYTERYDGGPLSGGAEKLAVRMERYRDAVHHDDGPLLLDDIDYADLFVEPTYQLLRLHLLAQAMQRAGEGDATCVRVVYAAPERNVALWDSVPPGLVALGDDLRDVWTTLLADDAAFIHLDTTMLVLDRPPSDAFAERYAHMAGVTNIGAGGQTP